MKNILHLLLLPFLFLSCQQTQSNSTAENTSASTVFEKLSKEVFAKKMEEKTNEILIDVRTPEEYQEGTIKSAININFYDKNFEEQISKLDKTKPVFVFCKSGGRSGKTFNKMKALEFQEVYDLKGGYNDWKK